MTSIDLQAREIKPLRNTYTHVAKYIGGDVPASRYQEATLGAQPTANFHYRPTWDPAHELFDASRSRIRMADWYALRDPRQLYYASWTGARAKQQEAVEASYAFVDGRAGARKQPELRVGPVAAEHVVGNSRVRSRTVPIVHGAPPGSALTRSARGVGVGVHETEPFA